MGQRFLQDRRRAVLVAQASACVVLNWEIPERKTSQAEARATKNYRVGAWKLAGN
jgi:hypothetical protein